MILVNASRQNHPKVLTAGKEVHVGVVGEFGASRVSPRQLLAACQGAAKLLLWTQGLHTMSRCRFIFRALVILRP